MSCLKLCKAVQPEVGLPSPNRYLHLLNSLYFPHLQRVTSKYIVSLLETLRFAT